MIKSKEYDRYVYDNSTDLCSLFQHVGFGAMQSAIWSMAINYVAFDSQDHRNLMHHLGDVFEAMSETTLYELEKCRGRMIDMTLYEAVKECMRDIFWREYSTVRPNPFG